MARTAAAIEAELAALKAAGVHHSTKEVRDLRAELNALSPFATEAPPAPAAPSPQAAPASDPADSPEWRFIEKCLADIEIDFGAGTTTGAVKKIFNQIDAKVKVWRMLRDIVTQGGVGAKWPQFAQLNRNPDTGEKVAPKPAVVAAPVAAPVEPPQTESFSEADAMGAMAEAMVHGDMSTRPEKLVPVG